MADLYLRERADDHGAWVVPAPHWVAVGTRYTHKGVTYTVTEQRFGTDRDTGEIVHIWWESVAA